MDEHVPNIPMVASTIEPESGADRLRIIALHDPHEVCIALLDGSDQSEAVNEGNVEDGSAAIFGDRKVAFYMPTPNSLSRPPLPESTAPTHGADGSP